MYLGAPVPVDVETELRLRAAGDPGRDGQTIVGISRENFDEMTAAPRDASGTAAADAPSPASPRLAG
jgi:hypothetical protein